ncbi:hypothetical protein N825_05495 [Skermanella stibiiresistens SB22]|uniref:Restriction endonuclease type IV Mrr domain-containing protein n=1 Tax=Skermanella stibiiresistens SB22 TaxID=1385369 RepID=W9H0F2_9PROT|nr:restriction endonuclease [Skermanella stibiiresistens]EWY39554.1 hypothetical protein N825_05495 [Skermanella stibiiresistens SB22]
MLKTHELVKTFEGQAAHAVRQLLEQVPAIGPDGVEFVRNPLQGDNGADLVIHLNVDGREKILLVECKFSGQLRNVRAQLHQLRHWMSHAEGEAMGILVASYLSPEAQALCRDNGVGFLDLEGNARIVFDGVFIERRVEGKPPAERRELKSLFKPKSAQVLRVMLRSPAKAWRVANLAAAANVSLGHVSNIRAALLDREWAAVQPDGLLLNAPDALLDAWRDAYEPLSGERLGFYTTLHGKAFEDAARRAFEACGDDGSLMFASFSAATWLAPYARAGSQFLLADGAGLDRLREFLKLAPASKGENVIVTVPRDPGIFRDRVEPVQGIGCTSPVQTYLDLSIAGEHGRAAAEHLRRETLSWSR